MSTSNSTFSERVAVIAATDPQVITNTNITSDYANMANFGRIAFVVNVGNIDAATTVDAAIFQATDSVGTGTVAVAGKAITQLSATSDNQQVVIELATSELSDGFSHAACRVTVSGTTATASVVGLGIDARNEPAKNDDLVSVIQIVGG